jgi:hypothetical protein
VSAVGSTVKITKSISRLEWSQAGLVGVPLCPVVDLDHLMIWETRNPLRSLPPIVRDSQGSRMPCQSGTTSHHGKVKTSNTVGRYVDPSDSWQWFYDPTSNALYHTTDDDWQAYTPTSSRSTHSSRPTNKAFKLNPSIFIPPNIRSLEPATTRPLSSLHDSDTVIFTGSAQPHQPAVQQAEEPSSPYRV